MNGLLKYMIMFACCIGISYSGRTCLSCSGIENLTDCTVIEACKDDEVCFTHKYTHGPNYMYTPELYDVGCTNQKLCIPGKPGSVFGKRGTGRHYVCETCCNNTDICNMKSACAKPSDHKELCESTNKEGNRKCLACNGVKSFLDCTEVETCKSDEVCFTHKYLTESNAELYDFGCTHQEVCHPEVSFGKRSGRHMMCETCCNNTDICNMKSSCLINAVQNVSCGQLDSSFPRECDDIKNITSGVYTIYPDGFHPIRAFCIVDNHNKETWTVIQHRSTGNVNFDRDWDEYKRGFGSPHGDHWLGNDIIHQISTSTMHKLSIYLEDFNRDFKYANYSYIEIGNEHRKYQLLVDGFRGTSGLLNQLSNINYERFSTKDQDNDRYANVNCAERDHGGWWYYSNIYCSFVNLNGPYLAGTVTNSSAMYWKDWPQTYYSLRKSTMMIKRASEK